MSDIDEVYTTLGFGRMQLTAFFTCLFLQIWMTNEQMGFAVVLVGATCELEISDERVGCLMCGTYAAQLLFSYAWGEMSDLWGRRKLLLISGFSSLCTSMLSVLMPEFWSFMAMRILSGALLAGPVGILMTYMGELTKVSLRPRVLNYLSYAIALSMIQVPTLAMVILPLKMDPIASWRVLLLLDCIPGICGLIAMVFMPESPKYYLSVDQEAKAMEVLERNCRWNKGKDVTLASLGIVSVTQPRLQTGQTNRCTPTKTLLTKYIRYMALMGFAYFILCGIGMSFVIWMLRIREATKSKEEPQPVCDHLHEVSPEEDVNKCTTNYGDQIDSIIHGFVLLTLFIATSLLLCALSRRVVIVAYIVVAISGCMALNFVKEKEVILVCFFALIDPPMCSIRMAMSLVIDLIPTYLRGKAMALINIMGRLGSMTISLFLGYTLASNCHISFNTLVALLILCGILVLLLPSEKSIRNLALV